MHCFKWLSNSSIYSKFCRWLER